MLVVGVPLLLAQFFVAFTRPLDSLLGQDTGFTSMTLHFAPYVLVLLSAYLLLPPGKTPGMQSRPMRIALTLLASWGAGGGIFLLALVLGFFVAGVDGVDRLVAHMPIALLIACALLFPVLYPRLR